MNKEDLIYVAGHRGLVGKAICANLNAQGYHNIITRSHQDLDLTNQIATRQFFAENKPDYVFLAAAKAGGIWANNHYRADFIYQNLAIQNHIIHESYKHNIKKLLFLGSTCIYPKNAHIPIKESALLSSQLEYTNEPYAIAKIAGMKMCESYNLQYDTNFISVMPTNLYGPDDNFDLENGHVIPALMRKIHLAKLLAAHKKDAILNDLKLTDFKKAERYLSRFGISASKVEIWGTGKAKREFLYSKDLADACVFLMKNIDFKDTYQHQKDIKNTHINIGTGKDISIKDLAYLIRDIIGFEGGLFFNENKLSGVSEKRIDISKLHALGWQYQTKLKEGITKLYHFYKSLYV